MAEQHGAYSKFRSAAHRDQICEPGIHDLRTRCRGGEYRRTRNLGGEADLDCRGGLPYRDLLGGGLSEVSGRAVNRPGCWPILLQLRTSALGQKRSFLRSFVLLIPDRKPLADEARAFGFIDRCHRHIGDVRARSVPARPSQVRWSRRDTCRCGAAAAAGPSSSPGYSTAG